MGNVKAAISMSLDGYIAGPNQSAETPLGDNGESLHEWALALESWRKAHGRKGGETNESTRVMEEMQDAGAVVMGRNMFGPVRGPWPDDSWRGWWGEEPPFDGPVFVLTHHARERVEFENGSTFDFVTDGFESALDKARSAANGRDVIVAGGASAIQQAIAAGELDLLTISVVPVLLGGGTRLLENLGDPLPKLEQVETIDAPGVTHLRFRVAR